MTSLATPPDSAKTARAVSIVPFREFFTLDVRSLALFRVALAVMLLLDWIDRLPDLRTLYSDHGIVNRFTITGMHPVSLHYLSGAVWFQAVLAAVACLFGLLLLVGYRTVFVTLVSWFLLISVQARNPAIMQGGDHLMRVMLFWSIFLPLGARYSVDASRPGSQSASLRFLSIGTLAYVLQLCQVYWYAAAWKWRGPWRDEGTAVYLALHVEYFTTRVGLWLRQFPELCWTLTHATIWLETLGPLLLLLPFAVSLQRLIAIFAFVLFHAGLALTLELGHFPFVCMVAWLPLIPSSFWNRLQAQMRDPALPRLRILFDNDRPRAAAITAWLRTFLLLQESQYTPAQDEPDRLSRLRRQGGWAVVDPSGKEHYRLDALVVLLQHSPVFYPLARVVRWPVVSWLTGWLVERVGGTGRGDRRAETPQRVPGWMPPAGLLANTLMLFCLLYVIAFNAVGFANQKIRAFHPELAERWLPLVPDQFGQFGAVTGLEQGWGVFAPEPGRFAGWFIVAGVRHDGSQINLLKDGEPLDESKPDLLASTFYNGRWRKLMMNLPEVAAYPYLLPGFTRFYFEEWNRRHEGRQEIRAVEVYWMREQTVAPDQIAPPPERLFLGRYEKPRELSPGEGPGVLLVVGKRPDGTLIDLLRGGLKLDWDNPDPEAMKQITSPWQPMLQTLHASKASEYMLPGFARFQMEEWNRQKPQMKVKAVEVVWVKPDAFVTGGPIRPADRKLLARYEQEGEQK